MLRPRVVVAVLGVAALGVLIVLRLSSSESGKARTSKAPTPVQVAAIERGAIANHNTFSGTIEARSRFVVAANASGRVEKLLADLADPVQQGQVVAELDDQEQTQGVAEARATQGVARANLSNAESILEISSRELARVESMFRQGLVSDSEVDALRARHVAQESAVEVARAQLQQSQAVQRRAQIRSGYAQVIASWSGDAETRFVAERHVAEGDTVSEGQPLLTVVDLDPLNVVVFVTERDYGRLHPDLFATLSTDGVPDREFQARVKRIAPVFDRNSRQARIELEVANPDGLLRPGMFARVDVVLQLVEDATIVPVSAMATRNGEQGVFVVNTEGTRVAWQPTQFGIQDGERIQVQGQALTGRVVTLGQQFLADGSVIRIPEAQPSSSGSSKTSETP